MPNRNLILSGIMAIAAMMPLTARAIEFHHPEGPFVPTHNCTCRFDGGEVSLGQRHCIHTAHGPRSALCVMEQNVTSWRLSNEGCPQAMLYSPSAIRSSTN